MSEDLEKLRSIGAQKIHERTHIAQRYVQALLHESFEGMQKVQLLGFISILEREYGVDLTSLRESASAYFETLEGTLPKEEATYKKELLASSKDDNKKRYIVLVILLVVLGVGLFYFTSMEKKSEEKRSTVTSTQVPHESIAVDLNESNVSQKEPKQKPAQQYVVEEKDLPKTLTILPKSKVWIGIIDLQTGKKRQKIADKPIELNASKEYLLTLGHGYIDIDIDGNKTSFKDPKSIKFLYKDGEMLQIDNKKFREYNKGKLW